MLIHHIVFNHVHCTLYLSIVPEFNKPATIFSANLNADDC